MSHFPCPFCLAPVSPAGEAAPLSCPSCQQPLQVAKTYRITGLLGQGGMGRVYEGRDEEGERVAIKIVALGQGTDWKGHELFARSAQVLQSLDHPQLPEVYAYEERQDGRLCLVREALDGGTLAERIKAGARRDTAQFAALLRSLLELLDYLHGLVPPVFHRDIKPQNLMFRTPEDWEPVLVDFDTVAAPGRPQGGLTIVGTPGYTAPEQFSGIVTAASDLYSLGMTLLYVATHTEPDALPRGEDGRLTLGDKLDHLPARLRAVLLRLTEPERGQRYARAAEALADLARAEAPPAPRTEAPRPVPAAPPTPQGGSRGTRQHNAEQAALARLPADASPEERERARRQAAEEEHRQRRSRRAQREARVQAARSAPVSPEFAARVSAHNQAEVERAQRGSRVASLRWLALAAPLLHGLWLGTMLYLIFFRRMGARGVWMAALAGLGVAILSRLYFFRRER